MWVRFCDVFVKPFDRLIGFGFGSASHDRMGTVGDESKRGVVAESLIGASNQGHLARQVGNLIIRVISAIDQRLVELSLV